MLSVRDTHQTKTEGTHDNETSLARIGKGK